MRRIMVGGIWLFLLVLVAARSVSAVENNGVVVWYKFNEGKGDVLKDYSGNGNDGEISGNSIISGNSVWVEEGKNGKSLKFDGQTTSYAKIPWSESFGMGTSDFLIEAWVKPDEITEETEGGALNRYFIMNAFPVGGGAGFELEFDVTDGLGHFRIILGPPLSGPTAGYFVFFTPEPNESFNYNDGKWHHVIAGRTSRAVFLVVDGKEFRAGATMKADITPPEKTGLVLVGANDTDISSQNQFNFKGLIGEIKVWRFDGVDGRPESLNFEPKTLK